MPVTRRFSALMAPGEKKKKDVRTEEITIIIKGSLIN